MTFFHTAQVVIKASSSYEIGSIHFICYKLLKCLELDSLQLETLRSVGSADLGLAGFETASRVAKRGV